MGSCVGVMGVLGCGGASSRGDAPFCTVFDCAVPECPRGGTLMALSCAMRLFFSAALFSFTDAPDTTLDSSGARGDVLLDLAGADSGSGVSEDLASRSRCSFRAFRSRMRLVTSVSSPSSSLSITLVCGSSVVIASS
jgi:hypothetical protein